MASLIEDEQKLSLVLACPSSPGIAPRAGSRPGKVNHHLLKHKLPQTDVQTHFGTTDPKELAKEITRMGQRELQVNLSILVFVTTNVPARDARFSGINVALWMQAKFVEVYGTATKSNNNAWLRRKLSEGRDPQFAAVRDLGQAILVESFFVDGS